MAILETQIDAVAIQKNFETKKRSVAQLRIEPLSARKQRLAALRGWIHLNRKRIHQAMFDDFGKPPVEVDAIEIFHVLNELRHAISNLERWAKPEKVDAPLAMLGTRSWIYYEPRGVCLIMSPWNYPFSLAVGPLISALAAGNAVIVKPSEMTANVSRLLKEMCETLFDDSIVSVIEGDAHVAKQLLKLPFDHIFFTGSPQIGKEVMKAAAENLASITLELGGKTPTIVTQSANIKDSAQRVAVAKFVNNGQTCVAPDYLLVDEKISDKFKLELIEQVKKLFSLNGDFQKSPSYCRIVNPRHFQRLNDFLRDALSKGATLDFGGAVDAETRFIPPMIISDVADDSRLMTEEIFGPILPIVTYKKIDEAIGLVNSKPKPLALYVYGRSQKEIERILAETSAGAVCINDSGIHFLHENLPFGGVNNSGIGKSHGRHGFIAFSNEKPVLRQKSGFTTVKLFYPPYTRFSRRIMDWFLKFF